MEIKTVCEKNSCTGCMACLNICPRDAITVKDDLEIYNAIIDKEKCINCNLCKNVCPNISVLKLKTQVLCKQGWAEDRIRKNSSSGGTASAIIEAFIKSGGYVASCLFYKGEFGFRLTKDLEEARRFSGSKYVKSNPGTIYRDIRALLKNGERVLFVGLPCQSAAVQNFCGESDNLYTIDLICHGTPSLKLLKQFIQECGFEWTNIQDISFRNNEHFGLSTNGIRLTPLRVIDSYVLAYLSSVDYTENCYSCRYATLERVADVTLGDAWGQLSDTVHGGVSLILCQTPKGIELLEHAVLHLEEVDLNKAVQANHQLRHPSVKDKNRAAFFKEIRNGRTVRAATEKCLPVDSMKQRIKMGLIKAGIIKDFKE